jgi:hypothetical protein
MSHPHRARMQRLLERELLGELAPRHRERLHEHLRSNERARAEYDHVIEAFRVLENRDVARAELDMVERWLFDGTPSWVETPRRTGMLDRVWTIAAVTLAAAAAAVLALRMQIAEPEEYMGVRQGSSLGSGLAIEALCGHASEASASLQPARISGCPRSGTLAFAYRVSPSVATTGTLALFGIDGAGNVAYYTPTPVDDTPIRVEIGRWHPLPMSVVLDVNHAPGLLRLYAVVTPEPLTIEDIDEVAAVLGSRDGGPVRAPWTARVGRRGRIGRLCAGTDRCPTAELSFGIHEDLP